MKIKKALILGGILLVSNGYCGLKYEAELARKFCPSLQLHSGDQGVSPKPVEIMSNGRVDGINSFLNQYDLYVRLYNIADELIGDFPTNHSDWKTANFPQGWWPTLYGGADWIYNNKPFKLGVKKVLLVVQPVSI